MKFKILLNLLFIVTSLKADNFFLPQSKVQELRENFRPILEVPSKFLKFKALWYEGNNRQQMSNILKKPKIKRLDLQRLIDLLNQEEKRLGYKTTVIADAVNSVIMKKFLRELSHLLPVEKVEVEARSKFINPNQLVIQEKERHKELIANISQLMQTLPLQSNAR